MQRVFLCDYWRCGMKILLYIIAGCVVGFLVFAVISCVIVSSDNFRNHNEREWMSKTQHPPNNGGDKE